MAHQIVLRFFPRGCLHDLDGTRAQGELVVRNHQSVVHANDAAKALAGGACAHGGVKREQRGRRVCVAGIAVWAMQASRKAPHLFVMPLGLNVNIQPTTAPFDGNFNRFNSTRFFNCLDAEPVSDDIKQLVRPGRRGNVAFGMHAGKAAG